MLVPVPSSTQNNNSQPELLLPVDYQRALEIIQAHVIKPEYESVHAWYHLGRHTKVDFDAVREIYKAEEIVMSLAYCRPGNNFITQFIEYHYYDLYLKKPEVLTRNLVSGKHEFPVSSVQALNAGNIGYAGIFFDTKEAQVREEFIPELERQGFRCWKSGDPYEGIYEGPLRNVVTLNEAFGPGAQEWMDEYRKGTGPECLIINR